MLFRSYKITIIGSISNAGLVLIKFLAGIFGNSSALIADAVHSLSDFLTDLVVLVFVKLSAKPKDENHSYGHGKFETLTTLIIGITLLVVGFGICWEGVRKIYDVITGIGIKTPDKIAFYVAVISIITKEILFRYTKKVGKEVKSDLVIANAWHHRSDSFSSIGTAIGIGGAAFLGDKWVVLDPIAAVIVSFFIISVSFKLINPSINELLEKSLPEDTQNEIIEIINNIPEIEDPHNLKTRKLGNDYAIELHVRVDPKMSVEKAHQYSREIENLLRDKYGKKTHVAIHIEPKKSLVD